MKTFYYKAKKGPESIVEGHLEAQSKDQVIAQLTREGLYPLEIVAQTPTAARHPWFGFSFNRSIRAKDRLALMDQLADMTRAGLTLTKALEVAARQPRTPAWHEILSNLLNSVRGGQSFSDSLERHPEIFSKFMVSMTRAGENSGALDISLRQIADALEMEEDLKSKVRQSLVYPTFILCFGIVTVIVLFIFVIPPLEELYEDFGGTLPLLTRWVIGTSRVLSASWWIVLGLAVAGAVLMNRAAAGRSAAIRHALLSFPWLGRLVEIEEHLHFTRTLGLLLKNGIPIIEALSISGEIVQETGLRSHVAKMKSAVSQGTQLGHSMEATGAFDTLAVSLVLAGEEIGSLDQALEKMAKVYEKELNERLKIGTTLLEPALILVIGGVVGVVVISMLLPIFQISILVR